MGVESTVYQYKPRSMDLRSVRTVLIDLGAENLDEHRMVLRGRDHWIDVQLGVPEPLVSFRVAVCNPATALETLRSVFEALLQSDGGELIDVEGGLRYSSLSEDVWAALRTSFGAKKEEFQRHFGEFEAAISADEVFELLERRDQ